MVTSDNPGATGRAPLSTLTPSFNRNPAYDHIDTVDTSAVWGQTTPGPRGKCISRKKQWLGTDLSSQRTPRTTCKIGTTISIHTVFSRPCHPTEVTK